MVAPPLEREYVMENKKIIAMMLTLSMLAAAFAGCLGGDDEPEPEPEWSLTAAPDVNPVWVESGWDPIIPNLNAGEMCEAIISAMTKTDERDQVVDFTRAYYTSSQGVIGGSGAAVISAVGDLNMAGTKIGLQSGTTSDLYAADNLAAATITAYEDFPSVIAGLNSGDVDYAMGDAPVLSLEGDLMVTFSDENFGLAIREGSGELQAALDVAIGAVVASGEYDAIYGAWFDGAVTLADDTTADTATAYPTPSEGSDLTTVLESGDMRLCTDPFYPPFENYDADGNVEGFDADMADAIVDEIAAHYMGTDNPMFQAPVSATTKIGLLNPLTGPIAVYAPPFTWAAQAAIDDLNAAAASVGVDMTFELVEADSGCSGDVASGAAQSLVDAGVVGVAGAACSGASMAANAVLNAAGVPQVSYASTNPGLSDADAYPGFWRVVPSDAIQGPAMSDMATAAGASNPALIHMTNDYGAGLADAFEGAWGTDNLCTKIGYEDTQTDFAAEVQAIGDAGCGSIVMVSYSTDGAAILETAAVLGISLPTFGADGIADAAFLEDFSVPAIANGVTATKPRAGSSAGDFVDECSMDETCAGGIYTAETYDAVMMIGQAAMHENGANMASHLSMTGVDYAGASGTHTFLSNGDVAGAGYDICEFTALSSTDIYFNCMQWWSAIDGIQDTPFTGATVKIGFLNPMTGPIAVYAPGFGVAANIALGMMNTAGWGNGLQFELVMADSGCGADQAAIGAQSLLDAGVVGVVGAACSGATMAANAVLSAAGVPMISYASTNPGLSDATAYPNFFRVVPSDALQGPALNAVVAADGASDVALMYMTNDYGSGFADAFTAAHGADNLCASIGYEDTITDFTSQVQQVMDSNCGSVVLISYAADGAAIVEELSTQGFSGQIFGGDGVAEEGLCVSMATNATCAGIVATKPASASPTERSMAFAAVCGAIPDCAGGIYTAEAFDAMIIMGYAVFAGASSPEGTPLSMLIAAVGQGFVGASGVHTFGANGDVGGNGYCVGDFTVTDGTASFDCNRHADVAADGTTTIS